MKEALRSQTIATLGSSLTASLVIHLAALMPIVVAGAGNGRAHSASSASTGVPLEVVLATSPRRTGEQDDADAPSDRPAPIRAGALPVAAPNDAKVGQPDAVRQTAAASTARGSVPTVTIDDHVPRARFASALEGGPLSGFPLEIEQPVLVSGMLAVPYPPAALASRREGRVLAWAIVDCHGAVEATDILEGEPDFAVAVQSALAAAWLVPARNGGVPIRHYVTLELAFRLDAADPPRPPIH